MSKSSVMWVHNSYGVVLTDFKGTRLSMKAVVNNVSPQKVIGKLACAIMDLTESPLNTNNRRSTESRR